MSGSSVSSMVPLASPGSSAHETTVSIRGNTPIVPPLFAGGKSSNRKKPASNSGSSSKGSGGPTAAKLARVDKGMDLDNTVVHVPSVEGHTATVTPVETVAAPSSPATIAIPSPAPSIMEDSADASSERDSIPPMPPHTEDLDDPFGGHSDPLPSHERIQYTGAIDTQPPFTFHVDSRAASVVDGTLGSPRNNYGSYNIASPKRGASPTTLERMFTTIENGFSAQRVTAGQIDNKIDTVIADVGGVITRLSTFQNQVNQKFVDIDAKFAEYDARIKALHESPPVVIGAPRASSAPPRRNVVHGVDHFEVKVSNWPSRTRTTDAEEHVKSNVLPAFGDIPITLHPPVGGYVPQFGLVLRFLSIEDRKIFLSDMAEKPSMFKNKLGVEQKLSFKPVIPKEIAVLTDMLGHFIYLMHRQLDAQPRHHEEMIKNYRAREVCLYDIPIAYYTDENGAQNLDKSGGTFTILGNNIEKVCKDKDVQIEIEQLIREVKRRFPDRISKVV